MPSPARICIGPWRADAGPAGTSRLLSRRAQHWCQQCQHWYYAHQWATTPASRARRSSCARTIQHVLPLTRSCTRPGTVVGAEGIVRGQPERCCSIARAEVSPVRFEGVQQLTRAVGARRRHRKQAQRSGRAGHTVCSTPAGNYRAAVLPQTNGRPATDQPARTRRTLQPYQQTYSQPTDGPQPAAGGLPAASGTTQETGAIQYTRTTLTPAAWAPQPARRPPPPPAAAAAAAAPAAVAPPSPPPPPPPRYTTA